MPDPQLSYPAFAAHGKFGGYGPLAFPMHRMGMTRPTDFIFGTQIRKSPFFDATMKWGVKAFSVYNHMYLPRSFGDEVANFWTLVNDAILCDVAAERQVEIAGPDAARFMQLLTPRDLSGMERGECKYIVLTDQRGGILNDPILLKLARDRFWISLADSDVLLWAKGVAVHGDMQVFISEPDASPLQLQGPKSAAIMQRLLGDSITDLEFFHHRQAELDRIPLPKARICGIIETAQEVETLVPGADPPPLLGALRLKVGSVDEEVAGAQKPRRVADQLPEGDALGVLSRAPHTFVFSIFAPSHRLTSRRGQALSERASKSSLRALSAAAPRGGARGCSSGGLDRRRGSGAGSRPGSGRAPGRGSP